MSKGLFFNVPSSGHVNSTLPLVAELVRRGETIIYYLTPAYQAKITATGAIFRQYSHLTDDYFTSAGLDGSNPAATGLHLLETSAEILPYLAQIIADEKPDYILYDSMCPWGYLAAKQANLPAISSLSLLMLTPLMMLRSGALWGVMRLMLRNLDKLIAYERLTRQIAREHGVPRLRFMDWYNAPADLTLSYTSDQIQPAADRFKKEGVSFIGTALAERGDGYDFPLDRLRGRPVIYISLGTVINHNVEFFRRCIAAFAGSDALVVMSIGLHVQPEELGFIPSHFIVRPYVPQLEVLKRASLFITHAGMNSVHESLYYHVPMLLVPQSSEQSFVARRLAKLGAGVMLSGDVLPDALAQAAQKVMTDTHYLTAARQLGDNLRSAGGVQRGARLILELIGR